MSTLANRKLAVDTERFSILNPIPPFVDICIKSIDINPREFSRVAELAAGYRNDPRLVEMVRQAGDASAKVPYLLDVAETPATILGTLREVAQPHVEYLRALPEPLRATVYLLLSINTAPRGCEAYAIAALLEIDRIQNEMIHTLLAIKSERRLAQEFCSDSAAALQHLDRDWPHLRSERSAHWHSYPLPEKPQMQYHPLYDEHNRLVGVQETCVIVESPGAPLLRSLIPPVLQRPCPQAEQAPATGSADWLLRDVGKIGRHFTRALLKIIKTHLEEEQVALEAGNYGLIARHAQDALREFVKRTP